MNKSVALRGMERRAKVMVVKPWYPQGLLIPWHRGIDLERPGFDAAAKIKDTGKSISCQKQRRLLAAAAMMTHENDVMRRREFRHACRQLRQRHADGAVDAAMCELPWLAHIDDHGRGPRCVAAPAGHFRGCQLRDQNWNRDGVAA